MDLLTQKTYRKMYYTLMCGCLNLRYGKLSYPWRLSWILRLLATRGTCQLVASGFCDPHPIPWHDVKCQNSITKCTIRLVFDHFAPDYIYRDQSTHFSCAKLFSKYVGSIQCSTKSLKLLMIAIGPACPVIRKAFHWNEIKRLAKFCTNFDF